MPSLLSKSTLRRGGSGQFIDLKGAQPQLPPTPTTSTGYTLVTDSQLRTSYRSSLGNLEFSSGTVFSNIANQDIKLIGTGTGVVVVAGGTASTSTNTGALIIKGGVGISDSLWTEKDIHVNGLTIGQGWQGLNNIVIKGVASPTLSNDFNGQESIVIGYDALTGLSTSYKSIAVGRYALSSGTQINNSIAIGDSALKNLGVYHLLTGSTITGITTSGPVVVITTPRHGLTTGTLITLDGIVGTTQLNGNNYYINVLTTATIALYSDINLSSAVSGTNFSSYISSGTVYIDTVWDDNIAIGTDAGRNIINGRQNLFVGDRTAANLTTGSYNIFLGHEVGNNMTRGTANISIGGDNLVDGVDNQVNIGSVFYYNGDGYLQLNSNTGIGLGTELSATIYLTNILGIDRTNPVVVHIDSKYEISTGTEVVLTEIVGTTELNDQIFWGSYLSTTTFSIYYDEALTQPVNGSGYGSYVSGGKVNSLSPYGALTVLGGTGITGDLMVTGMATFYNGMNVRYLITGTITTATNLAGGALGSIPYQTAAGKTQFIPIGSTNTVLVSNGTTATWSEIGGLSAGLATTATNSDNVFINEVVPLQKYYVGLSELIGDYSPIDSDSALTYITTNTNTSSYFVTGTNILNVPGSIYSVDGHPDENYLLYTPTVTISTSSPAKPRVGDFWINPDFGVELQYIKDGTSTFWIQFTSAI
jgi:Ubiquitin-activating enzyme E1 FCCH domain